MLQNQFFHFKFQNNFFILELEMSYIDSYYTE